MIGNPHVGMCRACEQRRPTVLIWGKFFPDEIRGPRCDECATDGLIAAGYGAAMRDPGIAIYRLPEDAS